MRAACLFGVLLAAKILMLVHTGAPLSPWAPLAWIWQDVFVALAFGVIDAYAARVCARVSRPYAATAWCSYAIAALYIAINVPIAFVVSSPLTPTMMRAARGALGDSIAHSLTTANVLALLTVAAVAIAGPLVARRWRLTIGLPVVAAALAITALGPYAAARVDTRGLDRNAVTALVWRSSPHAAAVSGSGDDWRASPFGAGAGVDLTRYRARAAGMNVLVVSLESAGAGYLKPWGGADDPMPNVTALAARSLVFDNAYAVYPESIKGLFSVLCSRYPAFGVAAEELARTPCSPLARELGSAGYRTGLFHSGRFGYLGMDAVLAGQGFDVIRDAGDIGGVVHSSFGVDEASTVANMWQWVDGLSPGRPFFATYLPVAGHHPYATPTAGPFPTDREIDRYRNALHYADDAIGAIVDGLRARHLDERTILVVYGDHGEAFGQHPGNGGHSLFIHEENVRVPYLVFVPGMNGARSPTMASLIDTAPTVLDLLGLPRPPTYKGASLLEPGDRMALFFTDYSLGFLGLRDGCWKDIFAVDSGRSALYDVCRDPGETIDVSAREPARVNAYRDRLERWIAAQKSR